MKVSYPFAEPDTSHTHPLFHRCWRLPNDKHLKHPLSNLQTPLVSQTMGINHTSRVTIRLKRFPS